MGLIIRSVAILLIVIVTTVSSILHIIYMEDFSKYFFSSSCAIQGFVVLYCYVLHSEDPFDLRTVYRPKSSPQLSSDDNHSDSVGSPLKRFSKNTIDYEIKQSIKSDILEEITDNPQEYFITQEKPVSIVSNLTSSLKKLDSNTEPKKSVTFRHDLITGCHEKSSDGHDTDSGCGDYCGSGEKSCCSYRNNSRSPLLETTAIDSADMVLVDDWQPVDFADASQPTSMVPLPAGSDTSIRCVVQPPPDMLATHVCVEVGLVKQHATPADGSPTIVVCSVDVEPCRQPHMLFMSGVTDKSSSTAPEPGTDGSGGDSNDDDVLDRISQDLDYLLNRKNVVDSNVAETDGDGDADRDQN